MCVQPGHTILKPKSLGQAARIELSGSNPSSMRRGKSTEWRSLGAAAHHFLANSRTSSRSAHGTRTSGTAPAWPRTTRRRLPTKTMAGMLLTVSPRRMSDSTHSTSNAGASRHQSKSREPKGNGAKFVCSDGLLKRKVCLWPGSPNIGSISRSMLPSSLCRRAAPGSWGTSSSRIGDARCTRRGVRSPRRKAMEATPAGSCCDRCRSESFAEQAASNANVPCIHDKLCGCPAALSARSNESRSQQAPVVLAASPSKA